jgi:hypothetical protein
MLAHYLPLIPINKHSLFTLPITQITASLALLNTPPLLYIAHHYTTYLFNLVAASLALLNTHPLLYI